LTPGAVLYRQGDLVRSIFVVRAGALKLSDVATSGEEIVIGFALPGETAGLEALAGYRYQRHATALRSVAYCEISIRQFLRVFGGAPRVPGEMLRITAAALDLSMRRAAIAHRDARARVAAFLLDISHRLAGKGIRSADFILPMPRRDIAAYLGLSLETVSRVLQDLHRRGLIAVRARAIRLQAFNQLTCLASGALELAPQPTW
jgi:CRP/FNR family transcriptional regulator